ncbi:hypothetical protein [Ramlibacter sp.]|uniref:hypothetical protein n=1 Tax=Ramlibacter sp. TaxID=1917967 RepID=UPI003D15089C
MKKYILTAAAVAACAFGGAARADLIDSVGTTLSSIFGVPYDARPSGTITHVYTDAYGRQVQVDAAGRHTVITQPGYVDQYGQVVPYGSAPGTYAVAPSYDNDRDGVSNRYDRYPNDPRYR